MQTLRLYESAEIMKRLLIQIKVIEGVEKQVIEAYGDLLYNMMHWNLFTECRQESNRG